MNWYLLNDEEILSIKPLKLKYRMGDQIIQTFCKIRSPQKLGHPPLFDLYTFQDSDKSTPESCTMHWNLIKDDQFGSIKLLKLKYKRGDQIIQTFCKIGSPQKLGPPL